MIFKFSVNGQPVEMHSDSAADMSAVMAMLRKESDPRIASLVKARAVRAAKLSKGVKARKNMAQAPRRWQRWTESEVRVLNENKNLKPHELMRIPMLSGRSIESLKITRGFLRNPSRTGAPATFKKIATTVLAQTA